MFLSGQNTSEETYNTANIIQHNSQTTLTHSHTLFTNIFISLTVQVLADLQLTTYNSRLLGEIHLALYIVAYLTNVIVVPHLHPYKKQHEYPHTQSQQGIGYF